MARRLGPTLAAIAALAMASSQVGCRSVGRFPTIDPSDYAYSYFNGVSSQVFQFSVSQVESATLMALGDLGFTKIEREPLKGGVVKIKCWTLDHRASCVWVKPRNEAMTKLTIYVGIVGDEMVSQTFMERVGPELRRDPAGADPHGTVARAAVQPDAAAPADAAQDGDPPRVAPVRRADRRSGDGRGRAYPGRATSAATSPASRDPESGPFGPPDLPIPAPDPRRPPR